MMQNQQMNLDIKRLQKDFRFYDKKITNIQNRRRQNLIQLTEIFKITGKKEVPRPI